MPTARRRRATAATLATAAAMLVGGLTHAVSATAQQTGHLQAAMALLGIAPGVASELIAGSLPDGTGDTFRYAVPGSRPATLTEPFVDIQLVGAAEVDWSGAPPQLACGGQGDALVVCAGSAPRFDLPHAVFWMQTGGDLPQTTELSASLAFPVLTPGGVPWVAQGPFQWDTFQGTDRWHDLGIRPDTDWEIVVQRWTGDTVLVEPTDAFAVMLGDTVLMAVPLQELVALPEGAGGEAAPATRATPAEPTVTLAAARAPVAAQRLDDWLWGAALHFHDGTFGSSPDDTSGVDSHPDTDTDTPRGPGELASPTSGPVLAAPPPSPTPSAQQSTDASGGTNATASDTERPQPTQTPEDGFPWILVLIIGGGIILLGGATFIATRPRTPPVVACDCKVTVSIEGPTEMGRCCMGATTWSTHHVEGVTPDGETAIDDPSQVHVDGDDADGHDIIDAIFKGTLSAQCSDGATARVEDATWTWTVTGDDSGFDVSVEVFVPVQCPNNAEHPGVTVTARHHVAFHSAPCLIGVIIEQVGTFEISHVDVQIICGEYNEIFGYFPTGARSFANTIGGAPGEVIRTSGARPTRNEGRGLTTGIVDEIGSDYGTSHSGKKIKVYWIEPEDCSVCERVRAYWENLAANPGTYYLLGENCATQGWKSLTDSGAFPPTLRPSDGPGTPGGIEARLRMDHEGGGGHVTDVAEIR